MFAVSFLNLLLSQLTACFTSSLPLASHCLNMSQAPLEDSNTGPVNQYQMFLQRQLAELGKKNDSLWTKIQEQKAAFNDLQRLHDASMTENGDFLLKIMPSFDAQNQEIRRLKGLLKAYEDAALKMGFGFKINFPQ